MLREKLIADAKRLKLVAPKQEPKITRPRSSTKETPATIVKKIREGSFDKHPSTESLIRQLKECIALNDLATAEIIKDQLLHFSEIRNK